MKYGLFLLLLIVSQNALALYGSKVESVKEPFMASLYLDDKENPDRGFFCSGVLIAPNKILTAGHCIDSMGLDVYEMSQALVYRPQLLKIEIAGKMVRAKSVTFSDSYFEGYGLNSEDLAIIELRAPLKNARPIMMARRSSLIKGTSLSLIARGSKVETSLLQVRNFSNTTVLVLDKKAGACLGDSGGAIVLKEKGQHKLAGILMYNGDRTCYRKNGYGHFPKARF